MRARLTTFIAWLIVTVLGASGAGAASDLSARTSTAAAITVKATPRVLSGVTWEFELTFDTHSGTLNDDLEKTVTLVADGGTTHSALKWRGDPPGGHHRKGVLQFKPISPLPASIELRITREGEPQPRLFKWSLK